MAISNGVYLVLDCAGVSQWDRASRVDLTSGWIHSGSPNRAHTSRDRPVSRMSGEKVETVVFASRLTLVEADKRSIVRSLRSLLLYSLAA